MTVQSLLKLYAALFICISFGVVFSFVLPLGLRIYPYDIPVLFLAPLSIVVLKRRRQLIIKNIYLLCFLSIGLLGLFFSLSTVKDLVFSLGYLGRLITYLILAIPIFLCNKKQLFFILKMLLVSSLLFTAIGYMQYFFYPDLANLFYFGWDRHLYRFFSTFLDPNFAGSYLVFLYITTIGTLQLFWKKHTKRDVMLVSFLFLPAIFLTYSRTAYIMLVVTLGTFLVFVQKKLLIFSFLLFLIALVILPKNLGGEGVNLLRTSSIISRIEANEYALSILIQNPIIGVGFNGLKYAYIRDGSLSLDNVTSHSASGVPNSYLYVLATTGVVGFGILLLFVLQVFKSLFNGIKNGSEYVIFKISILAGFVGVLTASLFENIFFYSPIFITVVICVACSIRITQIEEKR